MKTTFYDLSEATRRAWGYDPYDGDYMNGIVDEDAMEGSIGRDETGDILYFNLLSKKYKRFGSLDDWEIELLNIEEFPEIAELL